MGADLRRGFLAEDAGPGTQQAIKVVEASLTAIFVLEFVTRLVALIPTARGFRLFRLLRLLRLVRAFSGLFRALGEVERVAAHRGLIGLAVAWLAVMVICSVAFYVVENETNPGIRSPYDALWWGVATLTGGDPLVTITTPEGRIAAGVLLVVGVGLFGAITAVITSQILTRAQEKAHVREHLTADIPDQIRKLGDLRSEGLLTLEEFEAKKAELLARM